MIKIIYLPLFGAILEGAGVILQKRVLRNHKINSQNYLVYGFLAIVLVMLPFSFFFWEISPEAKSLTNIIIFLSIVIISIIANILIIYSLKKENITEIEPIRLMQPLFTILLAFILSFFFVIYSDEGSVLILLLGLIASLSLVFAHIKKHHLSFNKYAIAAIISSFLFSIELVISKFILSYYNSFTFYFLRCLLIFVVSWIIFHPKLSSIENKPKIMIFIGGIIWTIYRIIMYYGYATVGIVFTTMLFILAPIFIYLFAWMFLNEKIEWRQIISSVVIIICVVIAIIVEI